MGDVAWFKQVWASGPTYVNDRAVFLVLVDCMSHDGYRAWPSVATIAGRVGISERAVRTRLRALEADGWITTDSPGGGRWRTTTYVVNVGRFGASRNPEETRKQVPGKKPGRNPEVDAGNPEVDDTYPEATSAERLERLGTGGAARANVETPLPVIHGAPSPCPKHPAGWHHDEPCRRCKALREYDEQQRAAAPPTRARLPEEFCGTCDLGWVDLDSGVAPCPNGCLDPVALRSLPIDGPRPDADRNGKPATTEAAPTRSADYVEAMWAKTRERSRAAGSVMR